MKIYIKLPGGGEIRIEREPMEKERFEMLCWLAGVVAVVLSITVLLPLAVK